MSNHEEGGEPGEWDEGTDPDEWIVGEEAPDPEDVDEVEVGADGEYTCTVCGDTFASPEAVKRHLYRVGIVE